MAVGVRSATPRSPLPVRTTAAGPALARGGVPRTNRGAAEAGRRAPTRPPGDVWCREEDKHTGRGPALDAHAPGPLPSTPTPQGPGPRRPRTRAPALDTHAPDAEAGRRGGFPGPLTRSLVRVSIARRRRRARPAAAAGIREQAKRPLVRTSPPNGTAAGQADGVRTVRTAAARACSPTAGARETRAPPARWALHPNAAFALGSHLPWAAPAEGRARQTPWLGAEGLLPGPTLAQGLAGGFGETAGDLQGASALLRPRDLTPATRGQPALRASRPPSQGPSRALLSQREDPARPEQSE